MVKLSDGAATRNNVFLSFGVNRLNEVLSLTQENGDNAFVTTVLVPLTKMVFKEKGASSVPADADLYNACLSMMSDLSDVIVWNGGLQGTAKDYAQAEINNMTIHVNSEWVSSGLEAIDANPNSKESTVHKAVLLGKLIQELTHLYTRPILAYVYQNLGTDTMAEDLDFDTPVKIGQKKVCVLDLEGRLKDTKFSGDMGLAAEELIFGYRLNLAGILNAQNAFDAKDVIFADEARQGRVFKVESAFDAWAEAVIAGPVKFSSFKVTPQDTQALRSRKRPASSVAEPPSKTVKRSSSEGQVEMESEVESEVELIEGYEVVDGDGDEEEGLIPCDIALPKGWKN